MCRLSERPEEQIPRALPDRAVLRIILPAPAPAPLPAPAPVPVLLQAARDVL